MGLLDELKKYFALRGETLTKEEIAEVVADGIFKAAADASTNPGTPSNPLMYSASAGVTYQYFLDQSGQPITIPTKVGEQYVSSPRLIWNEIFWVANWDLVDKPDLSDDYVTTENGIVKGDIIITEGSKQLFDKKNMILYGFSLSNTGNPVQSTGSWMSKDIPIDPTKGSHIFVSGRSVRKPFVFLTSTGVKIPSEFGADYNAGPLNGVYPVPSNAAAYRFAGSYLGDGEGSENTIMINFGEETLPYEEYKATAMTGVKINGVVYPLEGEGGDTPSSSSFKFQGVKLTEDELIVISKYSEDYNLKTLFKVTGNNSTYLLNSQGKITRDNDGINDLDFGKSVSLNLLRWDGTDGIGPYQLNNEGGSVGFVGGNHGQPEPANPTPPYYDFPTSNCLSQEFWADGIKINPGDIIDAKTVKVRVENEVYNLDGILLNTPPQFIVDFHEIQEYIVIDGKVIIDVTLVAVKNISFKTVYSLQMQIGAGLEKIYFPHSLYNAVEARTVNPTTGDRSYGTKQIYPDFEKFIAMTTNQQDCSCAWLDLSKGLGTRSSLESNAPIARGKQGKLYHNVLNITSPVFTGDSLSYLGGINVFLNRANPANNTFAYFQYEKGSYDWEYKQYLICDFAGTVSGRSILVNYPEIIGKTLVVVKKDSTINVPQDLIVTALGIEIVCTGHGNVKFLIT